MYIMFYVVCLNNASKSKSVVSRQSIDNLYVMRKILNLVFLGLLLVVISCGKDDPLDVIPPSPVSEVIPPTPVSEVSVKALNSSVVLTWTNPLSETFRKTKITYGDITIEVLKGINTAEIESLTNGVEYTFVISTIDVDGSNSSSVSIKSTPDQYVKLYKGTDIKDGTYDRLHSMYKFELIINKNNSTNTMYLNGSSYIWKGTWSYKNDTTYVFNGGHYLNSSFAGLEHLSDVIKETTPLFCYETSDSTFLVRNAYVKIDGKDDFLPGSYKSYYNESWKDNPSSDSKTVRLVEISADGTIAYGNSDNKPTTGTWSNKNLLNGDFVFVTFRNHKYLVVRKYSILHNKRK